MSAEELCFLPATRLAALIAAREVSPVAVVEAVIARAEGVGARLNVFACADFEGARAAARAAEAAVMAGGPLGPLHGVPITVKDNLPVAGLPTGQGSIAAPAAVAAAADAVAVARVRRAGAIVLGKTTLPEYAHKVLTDSLATGVTRNPWNLAHTPGGSSGGAAAALAAGIAPLAIGTDGGGSIRCPSSCAGLVGLKPTLGRVPHEQMADGFGNFAFVGPMARNTADAGLLLSVLAGGHAMDPYTQGAPPLSALGGAADVRGLRIGWIDGFGRFPADAAVLGPCRGALAALEAAGARVEALHDPCFDDVFDTYLVIGTTAQAARLGPLADAAGARMTDSLRHCIETGRRWSAVEWQRAADRRTLLFRAVQRLFERFGLIATPTLLAPPPRLDAGGSVATAFYAEWAAPLYPFNLTGHPAASIPAGFGPGGLPIGLQLVAPWFEEPRILAASTLLEQALHWPEARPPEQ
jgi:aspartyl-tRNA(Asn)/glutamyl-tRNA(Gln) amidotransferase subunit A